MYFPMLARQTRLKFAIIPTFRGGSSRRNNPGCFASYASITAPVPSDEQSSLITISIGKSRR
jgi:hypothetical protein